MIIWYWRVSIASKEYLVLAVGILVFLSGCFAAVIRERNEDSETELKEDTQMTGIDLVASYGEASGAISLSRLENRPDLAIETGSFEGRVALITISPVGTDPSEVKVPSNRVYDEHEKELSESWTGYLAVDVGGKIVPGLVEVVLYG